MMKLAGAGVRMMALSTVLSLVVIYGSIPGWVNVLSRLLLLGGMVNVFIAGVFEARRELEWRAERRLDLAQRHGPMPSGIREDGTTCGFHARRALGLDCGSCAALRRAPEPARRAVLSPEKVLATSLTGPPAFEEVIWCVDRSGVLRAAWPVPSISAEVLAERMSRLGEALERVSRKMAPGHVPGCDCSECD